RPEHKFLLAAVTMARWIQEVAIARSARGLAACAPCTACVTPWLVRRRVATSTAIKRDPPVRREATYARAKHSPYVNTAVSRRDPIDSSRGLTTLTRHVWTGARAGRRKTRTAARAGQCAQGAVAMLHCGRR